MKRQGKLAKPEWIFIDTEVYIKNRLPFSDTAKNKLRHYLQRSGNRLCITSITKSEIIARIQADIRESENIYKKSMGKIRNECCLVHEFSKDHLEPIKFEEAGHSMIEILNQFLVDFDIYTVDLDNAKISKVFKDYYDGNAPFSVDKSKHEFPDAFVFSAIENWKNSNGHKVIIVSGDSDWTDMCRDAKGIRYFNLLDNLYEDILESDLIVALKCGFNKKIEEIKKTVESQYLDLGRYVADDDGEIDDLSVANIGLHPDIVINIQNDTVTFKALAAIAYSADVTYPDPDFSYYDKEEHVYHVYEYVHRTIESEDYRDIVVNATYDAENPEDIDIEDVQLDQADIAIDIHGPDW